MVLVGWRPMEEWPWLLVAGGVGGVEANGGMAVVIGGWWCWWGGARLLACLQSEIPNRSSVGAGPPKRKPQSQHAVSVSRAEHVVARGGCQPC